MQLLAGELRRFLKELGVVFALLMMLIQTYPAFSSAMGDWTSICTGEGIVLAQLPASDGDDRDAPDDDCTRCILCFTSHNSHVGVPIRSADIIGAGLTEGVSRLVPVASLVPLPDHFLPFSGAPPPYRQVNRMLRTVVPVSMTPTTMPAMPEIVSWH